MIIIIDSREKRPLDLVDGEKIIASEVVKLETGDYSIKGIDPLWICIERKASIAEMYACFTKQRERFFKEVERMKAFKYRFLIIEAEAESVDDLEQYFWLKNADIRRQYAIRQTASKIVRGSLLSLIMDHGVDVLFIGSDRQKSKAWVVSILDRAYGNWKREQANRPA